ncbi:hypothetical protein [Demequina lutea]|uniref:EcsC protein family protein n=1 Tax=Demequina lutea TaxID=431489 RepID=A0A7Z0CIJ3_9MICO|nr:hypothetical protein [Demequina lutea]NYI42646.1 hypothetical protein [Demequina lutea]
MTSIEPTPAKPAYEKPLTDVVVEKVRDTAKSDGFQARMYQAISIQRPVVLEYLKSLRRDKPNATPAEILKELDRRYIATVTITSTGVGASAAIPAVGTGIALTLGVADLLFFYETSALYVLAATELHGIEVRDAERARPLVFGMLLGEKSQSKVAKIVMHAAGAGSINTARTVATRTVGKALPHGWGEVLTQQLPDSALAPLATVLARQALRASGKLTARTLGKVLPFGIGAVIGGVGSFTFGRDVVKATRLAFPMPPTRFPDALLDFTKPEPGTVLESAQASRAMQAMQSAAGSASGFGETAWDRTSGARSAIRGAAVGGVDAVKGAAVSGVDAIRGSATKAAAARSRLKRKG